MSNQLTGSSGGAMIVRRIGGGGFGAGPLGTLVFPATVNVGCGASSLLQRARSCPCSRQRRRSSMRLRQAGASSLRVQAQSSVR